MIAREVVAGATPGSRTAFVLHGILGAGRNWRSFARRLADRHPDWRFVLPDLRGHGDSPALPAPHSVAACAADLAALAGVEGAPELVIGHSFGGKVALAYAQRADSSHLRSVVVLDAPPGASSGDDHESLAVLAAVRSAPAPAPSRDALRDHLRAAGLHEGIVAWLLTSTKPTPAGWTWKYDLEIVEALIADYFRLDLWPQIEAMPTDGPRLEFIRAGRSDRWRPADLARLEASPRVRVQVLPNAGHWLQVDDPEGLLRLLTPLLG